MKALTLVGLLIVIGCGGSPTVTHPNPTPVPQKITVFTGDSITQFWDEKGNELPIADAIDSGKSGDSTSLILSRFQADVIAHKPNYVFILGGTNDVLFNFNSIQTAVANVESMINQANTAGVAHIFIGTVTPVEFDNCAVNLCLGKDPNPDIAAFNAALLQMISNHPGVIVLDYHAALSDSSGVALAGMLQDGVHPTALGYSKMDSVVQIAISSMASK